MKKSDQGGIERLLSGASLPLLRRRNQTKVGLKDPGDVVFINPESSRRNQTKVGLKEATHDGKRRRWGGREEIRPRWDWKLGGMRIVLSFWFWRNQTKVGLKAFLSSCKMYWYAWRNQTKVGLKALFCCTRGGYMLLEEIRPRWDWKLFKLHKQDTVTVWKKSDQGGIESSSAVLSAC